MTIRLMPNGEGCTPDGPESGLRRTYSIYIGNRNRNFHVFLPSAYDGVRPLPLLITLHGNSGYQPERESWFYTAQREGLIVVYPEALKEEKWNIWGMKTEKGGPDDIAYLDGILDYMIQNFAVDTNRIYMHGQSMGDNMASYYAYHRSHRLAALAVTSGPVLPSVMYTPQGKLKFKPEKPLPVARTHGETDCTCGLPSTYGISKQVIAEALTSQEQIELRHTMDSMQKTVWKQINQTEELPQLYFDQEKNVEIYPGKQADFIFYSIAGGAHRPELYVFDMLWQGALDGYCRKGSVSERKKESTGIKPDQEAMAFAEGSTLYYSGLQVRSMEKDQICADFVNDMLYLSALTIGKLFPHIKVTMGDENSSAAFRFQDHVIQCAQGRAILLMDGYVKRSPAPYRKGEELMVSAAHLLPLIGSYCTAFRDGVFYLTTHPFTITSDGAAIIKEMLGTQKAVTWQEALMQEKAIRQKIEDYLHNS